MEAVAVLPELLRERTDRALLQPQVRDDQVLEIPLRDKQSTGHHPTTW